MVGDEEQAKSTTKKKLAKALGSLRPKSRNSGKQPSSVSGASLQDPATAPSKPSTSSTLPQAAKMLTDDDRTTSRYEAATKGLKDVVEDGRRNWEGFVPPVAESVIGHSSQLQEELDKVLNAWNVSESKNQGLWSNGKRLLKQMYIATSPFAKHFLLVAKDAAQVSPLLTTRLLLICF